MRVFDLHCDTIDTLTYANQGFFSEFVKPGQTGDLVHNGIQLAADRMPCPWCQCYAVWIPDDLSSFGMTALEFYRGARDWFMRHTSPDGPVTQVRDARDVLPTLEAGKVAALLTIENGIHLEHLELIDEVAQDGVKMVTLTWNAANAIAHGSAAHGGLTSYGREAMRALEDRRIVIDVSHLNDESFWDVARAARRPFAASHSNSRSVCGHPRNLTDDQFRAIVDGGGIVGINYFRGFVSNRVKGFDAPADGEVTFDELAAHVEHFLDLGGEGAIALGSDFDGSETPEWLDACEKVAPFRDRIAARFGEDLAERMFFGNAHEFFVRNETA
ncbi:MAG: membrane dipeptidase [Atopobiaceae bacterium]|nr:membrane dipeptidase [Atopobiaceae bacterium]